MTTSMIGLAGSPGTEVEPACSSRTTRSPSADRILAASRSYSLEEADRLARRLAIVDHGKIVVEGTPEELKAQLRGDAIQVELVGANGDGRARTAVERLEGVNEVSSDGVRLRARVASGATAVPMVIAALESEGIGVAAVTIARPSLDDVYLRYAGRAFSEADQAVLASEGGAR